MTYFDDSEKARKQSILDRLCLIYATHTDRLPLGQRLPLAAIARLTAIARVIDRAGEFAEYMRWYDDEGRAMPEPVEDDVDMSAPLSPAFQKALDRVRQMNRERDKREMN